MGWLKKIGEKIVSGVKKVGSAIKTTVKQIGKGIEKGAVTVLETVGIGKDRESMPTYDRTMAKFAKMAYGDPKDFAGYAYQADNSNDKMSVWWKEADKHLIISFRGTVVTDKKDILDDLKIIAGSQDTIDRVANGLKKASELAKEYGATRVTFTGHSLGGAIASEVLGQISRTQVNNATIDGWVFNPGYAEISIKPYANWKTGLHVLHISGDPISVLSRSINSKENETYLGKLSMNAHTIDQFV
jgi:hypothetical protein